MKSALFLASIALVLQLCPSFVIYNGPTRLVGEFMLSLKPSSHGGYWRSTIQYAS